MPGYDAYMICTTPRSGSTLLRKLLEQSGVAGHPGSHFHTTALDRWLEVFGLAGVQFEGRAEAIRTVVGAAKAKGTEGLGPFGLRMQRGSFAYFLSQLAVGYPDPPTDAARIGAAFGKTLYVHLRRENALDQAISRVKAEQTGLWHKNADGSELERKAPARAAVYDADQIAGHLRDLQEQDAAWVRWFAHARITPLRLSYEALAADPSGTLGTVLEVLGQDAGLALGITPPVARLADAVNHDWAVRFRAERGPDTHRSRARYGARQRDIEA